MKRFIPIATAAIILLLPSTANAQSTFFSEDINKLFSIKLYEHKQPTSPLIVAPPEKPAEPPKPEPVVYTVVSGDNLTKIGTAHNVEWQRLWAKNTQLTHPDVLNIGDKITIPLADEALSRDIPPSVALPAQTPGIAVSVPRGSSDGNTYDYGYCTWYVKNRRGGSIPNGLGNANTWYSRARAMGLAVGTTPSAGAVGTTTRGSLGHVVYVERVNGDGTIYISEMNAPSWGVTTYRTANASEFVYIY